jgi:hypothetical protein
VYAGQYPTERVRRRLYELYGLAAPRTPLLDADPPPVGRMRAAGPGSAE